jgi:hypothetical protein
VTYSKEIRFRVLLLFVVLGLFRSLFGLRSNRLFNSDRGRSGLYDNSAQSSQLSLNEDRVRGRSPARGVASDHVRELGFQFLQAISHGQ